jgi:hypothetical protein
MISTCLRNHWLCATSACFVMFLSSASPAADPNWLSESLTSLGRTVENDYENMYLSPHRIERLGIAFGTGAIMANTHIDQGIRDWYQDHERSSGTDHVADVAKNFGEGAIMIPVSVGAAVLGDLIGPGDGHSPIGQWGARTARAYAVGAPALLLSQWVTGGARPDTGSSHWKPFAHDNGVSGHAFIGGIPFLVAGNMFEDNPLARYALYALSTLPAWSRINDDAHYTSQALLGWFLAYEAAGAVFETDEEDRRVSLTPVLTDNGPALGLLIQW